MRTPTRVVRLAGHEPDLPAERIDAIFHAALAQIKAQRGRDATLDERTAGSSLSTVYLVPRWLKW